MKITIETIDSLSTSLQIEAVKLYIELNINTENCINTTAKYSANKMQLSNGKRIHVLCSKTKAGNYNFKTWNGV